MLRELAGQGFRGSALGDLGYRGKRLAKAGQKLGITVKAVARGRDGVFLPTGICWVVERSFAWISRYRRLNIIFERTKERRSRTRSRSSRIGGGGTKLGLTRPWRTRSAAHSASLTSVLRPGTFLM